MVWDVRRDEVELGDGQTVTREVHRPPGRGRGGRARRPGPGAAAPAVPPPGAAPTCGSRRPGCSTSRGRTRCVAAQRELAEEADLDRGRVARAGRLLQLTRAAAPRRSAATWPAALHEVPHGERHEREHEERGMVPAWVPARGGSGPGARRPAAQPDHGLRDPRRGRRAGRRLGLAAAGRRAVAGALARPWSVGRSGSRQRGAGRARRARAGPAARSPPRHRPSSRRRRRVRAWPAGATAAGPGRARRAGRRCPAYGGRGGTPPRPRRSRPPGAAARRAPG